LPLRVFGKFGANWILSTVAIAPISHLFGVIIIAITTGLGGGSLRDLLLNREVFWVADQVFFIASLLSAIFIFLAIKLLHTVVS
jgi:uncharacterized membrane protein YeiH